MIGMDGKQQLRIKIAGLILGSIFLAVLVIELFLWIVLPIPYERSFKYTVKQVTTQPINCVRIDKRHKI
jgi:hypothetical protein